MKSEKGVKDSFRSKNVQLTGQPVASGNAA